MADQDIDVNGMPIPPGLCGCGHDNAYHYRPVYQMMEGQGMVLVNKTGCTTCLCNRFDAHSRPAPGTGAYASKDYPDGGKH